MDRDIKNIDDKGGQLVGQLIEKSERAGVLSERMRILKELVETRGLFAPRAWEVVRKIVDKEDNQ